MQDTKETRGRWKEPEKIQRPLWTSLSLATARKGLFNA